MKFMTLTAKYDKKIELNKDTQQTLRQTRCLSDKSLSRYLLIRRHFPAIVEDQHLEGEHTE